MTSPLVEPEVLERTEEAPAEAPVGEAFEEGAAAEAVRRRSLWVWIPVFLALVALFGLLAWGIYRQQRGGPTSFSTNEGPATVAVLSRPAADFTLPLYEPFRGKSEFTLSDYRGNVVIINFWASWCPPCREEAPVLEATWRQLQGRNVILLGVDIWDTEEDARAYMAEFDITYPNAVDPRGRLAVEYGVTGIPETYFITPDGMIRRKVIGAITAEIMLQAIAEAFEPVDEGR